MSVIFRPFNFHHVSGKDLKSQFSQKSNWYAEKMVIGNNTILQLYNNNIVVKQPSVTNHSGVFKENLIWSDVQY